MSASSKKKLRREQDAAALTERQQAEQVEAKKLRNLTIVFVTVIALVVLITVGVLITRAITKSGIQEKNTVAVTLDGEKLSNAELSYYYIDAINNFYSPLYSQYSTSAPAYALMMYGVDVTSPLDEQVYNQETGETWADYFIDQAILNAQSAHALYNEAKANNFELSEEEAASIETVMKNMELYASLYGYSNVDAYLDSMYGYGSSEESYEEYYTKNTVAYAYQTAYSETLTYDDAALREQESENYNKYSSFSYDVYTVYTSSYLEGGTKDEETGAVTYTDEERAAAVEKAEEVANSLIEGATTVEDVDKAIAALVEGEESSSATETTKYTDRLYTNIAETISDWLVEAGRVDNDMAVLPYTTTSTDADGNEKETVTGYYVVIFHGVNENTMTLPSVRHLLVAFEGGTTDETTGETTYTLAETEAAKEKAEELLKQWQEGDATEESFATLANENSDDGDGTTGGLYEGILPGKTVEPFEDWCFDTTHEPGDVELVETEFGWHIMYYVSAGDQTYRDYMIEQELLSADMQEWYDALVEAVTVEEGNTSKMNKSIVIAN